MAMMKIFAIRSDIKTASIGASAVWTNSESWAGETYSSSHIEVSQIASSARACCEGTILELISTSAIGMPHAICQEEQEDMEKWLSKTLPEG